MPAALILAPKKKNKKGMGIIATASNPMRLLAQSMPIASKIGVTNSGKTLAKSDLKAVLPAMA